MKKIFLIAVVILGYLQGVSFAQSCNFNGIMLLNGQSTTGYRYANVAYGLSYNCNTSFTGYDTFQCQNGYLTGLNGGHYSQYPYLSCNDNGPLNCIFGSIFGQQSVIPHYDNAGYPPLSDLGIFVYPAYKSSLIDNSMSCVLPSDYLSLDPLDNGTFIYCKNGTLYNVYGGGLPLNTNIYKHTICSNNAPRDCQLGNTIVKHSESITTFNNEDSRIGGSCISEVRTCTDGVLSGSLSFLSCRSYNGICGASHGEYFGDKPNNNLCSAGIAGAISYNTLGKQRSRSCIGDGGTDSTCVAYRTGNISKGVCNLFPDGAAYLSSNNGGLCQIGVAYDFQTFNDRRVWKCTTSLGLSNCEAKKAIFPEGRIVYSTTSPTNNNVTAYVLDIKPYGTIIQNNGGEASKVFQKNGSFTFSLKFDDKISYLTATVDWINTRPITLADLSYDYQSRKCKENRTFVLPTSTKYNLLNMQTMLNNCIFQNMISKGGKITVRGTNNLSYKAFIESLYYFVKTIRKYDTMPTARNDSIKYKNLPRTKDFKYIVGWFNAIGGRRHINHKSSKNVIDIQWNKPVTPKEVYNTIYSILQNHEDTASHRKSLWEQSEITNKKSISYNDYASLIRRLLEAYDRVPIGINDSLMYSIYQKVKDQNIEEQKKSISNIMLSLKKIAPDKAEKQGLSLLRILEDLSAVYNNTIPKRKGVMTISLDKVQQRVGGNNNSSKINTLDMNIDSLFSKMSY